MRKQVFVCYVVTIVLVFMGLPSIISAGTTAVDMWYPGGTDSYWKYNVPSLGQVTATVRSTEIDGRKYKLIQEDYLFIGALLPGEPNPFLTFREDEEGCLRGYGVAANKVFEDSFQKVLVEFEWQPQDFKFRFPGDEWTLLVNKDFIWTVMKIEVEAPIKFPPFGRKIKGVCEIRGELLREDIISTEAGEFDTFVVDYILIREIEGVVDRKRFFTVWLAPNVGLVQIEGFDDEIATLSEYHVTPNIIQTQGKDVKISGRLFTTWAKLKQLHQ